MTVTVTDAASTTAALLADAAEFLRDVAAGGCPPDLARRRLEPLRARHPEHDLDLVWDEEPYDRSVTYDLVMRGPGGVTLSLGMAAEPGLPWPLRGVVRAAEQDLVRVGTRRLAVGEALECLDFIWDDRGLLRTLVDACIAGAELERDTVELRAAELQAAADAFRRSRGLCSAEETARWLAERNLSLDNFARIVARTAALTRLQRRVAEGRADAWFAEHAGELATMVVAWVADGAELPASALRTDPLGTVLAARRAGLAAGVEERRAGELPPGMEALRDACAGSVHSVLVHGAPARALVVEVLPARLDADTRREVERRLFAGWLAERRRDADVEWFWGNTARTRVAL